MENVITLHAITMRGNKEVAPGLFTGRDQLGGLRVHDGKVFLAYTTKGKNRKGQLRYGYHAWGLDDYEARETSWKTLQGAELAMARTAIKFFR